VTILYGVVLESSKTNCKSKLLPKKFYIFTSTTTLCFMMSFDVSCLNIRSGLCDHGLRGSASPVLTATSFVNGRGQYSTPTESTPLDRSPKKLLLVIMSATPTAVPNLVQIRPRGASGQMGEI